MAMEFIVRHMSSNRMETIGDIMSWEMFGVMRQLVLVSATTLNWMNRPHALKKISFVRKKGASAQNLEMHTSSKENLTVLVG